MTSEKIRDKRTSDYILELFEFTDDLRRPVSYFVRKTYIGISVFGSGAAKIEEVDFSNKEKAMIFFNNQN